jgi:hypothetical protein
MNKLLKILLAIFFIFILIISVIRAITKINRVVVVSVQPDLFQKLDIYQEITLELNKSMSQAFVDSCNIKTEPFTEIELGYDNKNLVVSPKSRFQYAKVYQIFIECQNFSTIVSFETAPYEQLNDKSKAGIQIEKDIEFAQEVEQVYQSEPWREKLPLFGENYEVNYLQSTNNYIVSFNKPVGSELTIEDILPTIKARLEEIGAPDLEFVW